MGKLSDEQAAALAELEKLRDAPDEPDEPKGAGRLLNITIDLGDDAQLEKAFKLGLLEPPAADEPDEADEPDDDAAPKRGGFFKDAAA